MPFRDLHALMTQQYRDLIDGHPSQQHFNREGVAEHMRLQRFRTIWCFQTSDFEEPTKRPLPVGNNRFRIAVAAPEKVSRIRLGARRNIAKILGNIVRQWNVNGNASLCLIEKQIIVRLKACFLQCHGFSNAQAAPTQQLHQRTNTLTALLNVIAAISAMVETVRCFRASCCTLHAENSPLGSAAP